MHPPGHQAPRPPASRGSANTQQLMELEKRVHEYMQGQEKAPCSAQVCKHADAIAKELGMSSFKSSYAWYTKFTKRHLARERTGFKDGKNPGRPKKEDTSSDPSNAFSPALRDEGSSGSSGLEDDHNESPRPDHLLDRKSPVASVQSQSQALLMMASNHLDDGLMSAAATLAASRAQSGSSGGAGHTGHMGQLKSPQSHASMLMQGSGQVHGTGQTQVPRQMSLMPGSWGGAASIWDQPQSPNSLPLPAALQQHALHQQTVQLLQHQQLLHLLQQGGAQPPWEQQGTASAAGHNHSMQQQRTSEQQRASQPPERAAPLGNVGMPSNSSPGCMSFGGAMHATALQSATALQNALSAGGLSNFELLQQRDTGQGGAGVGPSGGNANKCCINLKVKLLTAGGFHVNRRLRVDLDLNSHGSPINGYEVVMHVITSAFKDELEPDGVAASSRPIITLTYVDEDGDDVVISSNHELAVAIHYAMRLHHACRPPKASEVTLRLTLHCNSSIHKPPMSQTGMLVNNHI